MMITESKFRTLEELGGRIPITVFMGFIWSDVLGMGMLAVFLCCLRDVTMIWL